MPVRTIRRFIQLESSGGVLLFAMAVLAMLIDNSGWTRFYHLLLDVPFRIGLGEYTISKPILLWINDGLMAIFFLLVGLEIKREMLEGELNSLSKSALPAIAAVGGMVVPALVYCYFNWGDMDALQGWAVPTATDIAFSLGILSLLGSRIPQSVKIFLTALAIFDDVGAILIIAVFYTKTIAMPMLLVASGFIMILIILNRFNVTHRGPYFLVGLMLWVCVLKSGVHATLAGILVAFAIPLRDLKNKKRSPLRDLEHALHPWVAFLVLPLFAFANAGISFRGFSLGQFVSPIPIGIALGLFFGKQAGIFGATWLGVKLGLAKLPKGVTNLGVYGVSLVAGVGFTMSLFIGMLAFADFDRSYAALLRVGVLAGSFASGLLGYIILRYAYPPQKTSKKTVK